MCGPELAMQRNTLLDFIKPTTLFFLGSIPSLTSSAKTVSIVEICSEVKETRDEDKCEDVEAASRTEW